MPIRLFDRYLAAGPKYMPLGWRPQTAFSTFRARILIVVVGTLLLTTTIAIFHRPVYPWPRPEEPLLSDLRPGQLEDATTAEVTEYLETAKHRLLTDTGFSSAAMSKDLRAPLITKGQLTFSMDTRGYRARIESARASFPDAAHLPRRNNTFHAGAPDHSQFPAKIWSTDKNGVDNLTPQFGLWKLLNQSVNMDDFPEPPQQQWDVSVADDDEMDRRIKGWLGTEGKWADFWAKLHTIPSPVLRADSYRYFALLFEGGIYSDSDAGPLAHPYTWAYGAPSIVHPEIESLLERLYGPHGSSLLEGVSMVTSIECDNSWAFHPNQWKTYFLQLGRYFVEPCSRNLQFPQYLMATKPNHPVFVDTLQSVYELINAGDFNSSEHKGAMDLTGPGPYSDSMFRYLLTNYGVEPGYLKRIQSPVRVGDILILPTESLFGAKRAVHKMLEWNSQPRDKPWLWGYGWYDWLYSTPRMAYHGLAGRWRGKGFD